MRCLLLKLVRRSPGNDPPWNTSAISSQYSASSMKWVVTSTATPFWVIALMCFQNSRLVRGSTPEVGSSRNRTDGSCSVAQAMASRCFCPSGRLNARTWRNGSRSRASMSCSIRRAPRPPGSRRDPRADACSVPPSVPRTGKISAPYSPVWPGLPLRPRADSSPRRNTRPPWAATDRTACGKSWTCPLHWDQAIQKFFREAHRT